MEFSIATLLSYFSEDKLVAGKVLEKKLECANDQDIERLQVALDILEKIGVLTKEFGKYRRVYQEDVVEAKLRCSSKGFCFAIQNKEEAEDIYVRESHLSNAWNGDRVLVKVIKEGSRRRSPEGEVMLIVERANPTVLARIVKDNDHFRAVPLDDRLLFELNLQINGDNLDEAINHLVHVKVLRYPIAQFPPIGKVSRILGSDAEEAADTDIVCCKHDLPQFFSENLREIAQELRQVDFETELQSREDLRDLLTISISEEVIIDNIPLIENAFSLEKISEGRWQLGIHISDVDYFVDPESPLDKEARKRGTAIYLVNKVLPLFPEDCNHHLSLTPGKDCLSVSVLITMDDTGQIIEYSIVPSIIKVDHHLSYQQIQGLLGAGEVDLDMSRVLEMLNQLFFSLAPLIKSQRLERGGFDITLDESNYYYIDDGRLGAIVVTPSLPIRSLLTEVVVLANRIVSEHLYALGVPAIYCSQSEPDWDELQDLFQLVNNLGLNFKLDLEEDITPQDFYNLTQEFAKTSFEKVLHYLLQSGIKPITYTINPSSHFGLALKNYTHCVSPGKRYVDLLIQRVLKKVFQEGRDRRHSNVKQGVDLSSSNCHGKINWNILPPSIQTGFDSEFHSLISHLNEREKIAEDAETDLEGLKKAEKMKQRTGEIFNGLITGVQSYGFFVEIEDLLVEGLVHVSSLKDDWYEYRSRHNCLVGRKNRTAYRLGDRVEVEVKSVDYYRQQIDLVTVRGGSTLLEEDLED